MKYPNIPTFDPRLLRTGTDLVSVQEANREWPGNRKTGSHVREGRHLPVSPGLPPFSEKLGFLNDVFNLEKNVSNTG